MSNVTYDPTIPMGDLLTEHVEAVMRPLPPILVIQGKNGSVVMCVKSLIGEDSNLLIVHEKGTELSEVNDDTERYQKEGLTMAQIKKAFFDVLVLDIQEPEIQPELNLDTAEEANATVH